MSFDPKNTNHDNGTPADLPESPPGAPEGHDGASRAEEASPLVTEREPGEAGEADGAGCGDDGTPVSGAELKALIATAAKADEYLNLAKRTQADFENYRKRSTREAAAAQERGAVKLAKALLPAVDNLERALAHADSNPTHPDDFVAGLKHVHSDVVAALAKAGIEGFSPDGEPFDPMLHEAVAQQPIEGAAPGTVVEVFQRGYRIGETVVRPARVVVAG
jgi:molecular chaperone GrpE